MGPGFADSLLVTASPGAQVMSVRDLDGRGTYEIRITWSDPALRPDVMVGQFGRPRDALRIMVP